MTTGQFLQSELDKRGWTQKDFAYILGRPVKIINQIIRGKVGISARTAHELEQALKIPAADWCRMWFEDQLARILKKQEGRDG